RRHRRGDRPQRRRPGARRSRHGALGDRLRARARRPRTRRRLGRPRGSPRMARRTSARRTRGGRCRDLSRPRARPRADLRGAAERARRRARPPGERPRRPGRDRRGDGLHGALRPEQHRHAGAARRARGRDGGLSRLGGHRRRGRSEPRPRHDPERSAPAQRVLERDRTGGDRRRSRPEPAPGAPRRPRAARHRGREGVLRRPRDARVDLPRRLVRRARTAADRVRVRLPEPAPRRPELKPALLLAAVALAAAGVERSEFRWTRTLSAPVRSGPIVFDADPSLFAYGGPDLSGLRIVDAGGAQVPWRPFPPAPAAPPQHVTLLDSGRGGGAAVALADLGVTRHVHDRIDLDVPGHGFVGTVTVSGSDDRQAFTVLGSTRIFDLAGAGGRVRSTAVAFPPSDFRYLRLRATGIARIDGATISGSSPDVRPRPVPATVHGLTIDLGGANVPVDTLRITASNARYDRLVRIEARNGGGPWQPIGHARIYRL